MSHGMSDNEVQRFGKAGDTATSLDGMVRASNESFSQDIDGICTATVIYTGDYFKCVRYGGKIKEHPDFSDLVKTNFGVQRLDGTLGRVTCTFKGIGNGDLYMRYNVDSGANAQPIETHPFFKNGKTIPDNQPVITQSDAYGYRFGDKMEGGSANGSKQAFYDQTSLSPTFKHFPVNAMYHLAGVTQYLSIGMTLNLICVSHVEDNFSHTLDSGVRDGGYAFHVGQVCDPPSDIDPSVDTILKDRGGLTKNYNWMITKCGVEIVGSAMRQNVEFTLSGYRGWNKLIYDSADSLSPSGDKRFNNLQLGQQ